MFYIKFHWTITFGELYALSRSWFRIQCFIDIFFIFLFFWVTKAAAGKRNRQTSLHTFGHPFYGHVLDTCYSGVTGQLPFLMIALIDIWLLNSRKMVHLCLHFNIFVSRHISWRYSCGNQYSYKCANVVVWQKTRLHQRWAANLRKDKIKLCKWNKCSDVSFN